jgi:hypothetical protein
MTIIKAKDKRSGIIYAYENTSFRDPETKKPRSRRRLIGRVDPASGEILPTDGRCRRLSPTYDGPGGKGPAEKMTARQMRDRIDALSQEVEILGKRVRELTEENAALRSAGRA